MPAGRILLMGFHAADNRGVEALLRGTVAILNDTIGRLDVVVPTRMPPPAETFNVGGVRVEFRPGYSSPIDRAWVHAQRLRIPGMIARVPPLRPARRLVTELDEVDAYVRMGGDDYSLDYRVPTPIMRLDKAALDLGIPSMLWASSIGPFEAIPCATTPIIKHLERFDSVTVRESISHDYLAGFGLASVLAADAAFWMEPIPVDLESFWPSQHRDTTVGLNVSPLVGSRYTAEGRGDLLAQVAKLVDHIVCDLGMHVLLVPHVVPADGFPRNNDARYLRRLYARLDRRAAEGTSLMPGNLGARETKFVISHVVAFVGARMHSTIAAISSAVPTISIAYSRKAQGVNEDVFGNQKWVLNLDGLEGSHLIDRLDHLMESSDAVRTHLEATQQRILVAARQSGRELSRLLG